MYVKDLEKSKEFYIKYFNAIPNEMYHNPKTGLKTYFLSFENDCRLEIMTKPELSIVSDSDKEHYGYVHLAFSVGNEKLVDTLTDLLRSDGFKVYSEPRRTGDGYYESCVSDPDGNRIEIVA